MVERRVELETPFITQYARKIFAAIDMSAEALDLYFDEAKQGAFDAASTLACSRMGWVRG